MQAATLSGVVLLLLAGSPAPEAEGPFVSWARSRAVAIEPSGGAFRALDEQVEASRLIGVGESVHEVQTFLTFRLQLLQDLVRRHRVTALVLESGLPEARALDDYVRGRSPTVDFDRALPGGLGALVEVRRTMEWLREWNLGAGREHPVAVYGADVPASEGSMLPALDALEELTAGDAAVKAAIDAVRPLAVRVTGRWWRAAAEKYEALPADERAAFTSDVSALVERVQAFSHDDRERVEWARRLALVALQNETMLRLGPFWPTAPRDRAMAENTFWVLGRLKPGERAVYWAHNAHVQRVPIHGPPLPPGSFAGAGSRFAAVLGTGYLAIATAYGGPSLDEKAAPVGGSVDAALQTVATHPFLLPLRDGSLPSAVSSWLAEERPMRFQVQHLVLPLGPAFDAVAYFDRVAPASRSPEVSAP
jgi:erythromycin esterase